MDRRALATIAFVCAATASVALMGCGASATTVTVTKTVERTMSPDQRDQAAIRCEGKVAIFSEHQGFLLDNPSLADDRSFSIENEEALRDLGYYCATFDDLEREIRAHSNLSHLSSFTRKEWCTKTPLLYSRLCSYGDDPA